MKTQERQEKILNSIKEDKLLKQLYKEQDKLARTLPMKYDFDDKTVFTAKHPVLDKINELIDIRIEEIKTFYKN